MARWIGFCAPGRKPLAWLQVLLSPERVVEIYESATLEGRTDVILANLDAMDDFIREAVESTIEARSEGKDGESGA